MEVQSVAKSPVIYGVNQRWVRGGGGGGTGTTNLFGSNRKLDQTEKCLWRFF